MTRPNTPDRVNADGSRTMTSKRACNGCSALLGDVTDHEMAAAIAGRPMPDVRKECPVCGPTAPEPACIPMKVAAGDGWCLLGDCSHDIALDAEYCVEVRTETICGIHSTFAAGFEDMHEVVTHSEPWPCKHTPAVTA
jgi:hypothetical protein